MPARNVYHDAVIAALVADGWTITDARIDWSLDADGCTSIWRATAPP